MLCFGRRSKRSKKKEFARLDNEPFSRHLDHYAKIKHHKENHQQSNIPHVTSQHMLFLNGKPLLVVNDNGENHMHEFIRNETRNDVKLQNKDYENLVDLRNVYLSENNNTAMVQRYVSAYSPTTPQSTNRESNRQPSRNPLHTTARYVNLEDIYLDWATSRNRHEYIVGLGRNERNFSLSQAEVTPISTETNDMDSIPQRMGVPQGRNACQSVNNIEDLNYEYDDVEETLAGLDDTLNSYCIDELDDILDSPINDGGNEAGSGLPLISDSRAFMSSLVDSGLVSPNDSFASNFSRSSFIAHDNLSTGRKRPSVSFLLPANHVDKPYSPMHFRKSKYKIKQEPRRLSFLS